MSGPKVVRIVTPAERKLIKKRWLTRLKNKIEHVKAYAIKHNMFTEELQGALDETLEYYQNISEDDYRKIEREVSGQIEFLDKEKKNLVKKVVKIRTSKWESFKNLKSTHNELRFLLKNKSIDFQDFDTPSNINEIEEYREKVDYLYSLLKEASFNSQTLTNEQKAIQERLSSGDSLLSVQKWRSNRPKVISRLKKLENALKEMYISEIPQNKIHEFMNRCAELEEEAPNYDLLLDSLTIQVAEFSKNQLALREAKEKLKTAIDQLESLELNLSFIDKWIALLNSDNLNDVKDALEKAKYLYTEVSEKIIIETRRKAIKKALQNAGYEVNDTMETAWVENGSLVVKKAKNSLYGVEFMSPKNLSRIQARVVADKNRNNERSPNLDKNQEEIWCDEFYDIKTILESQNLSIVVDKAEEAGAVKMKEIALGNDYVKRENQSKKRKNV
ncbi:hypothetical protein SAMN05444344_0557 [Tenacibaculum mesophilum]|uniref:Uncharacterized protein n=1 Tax=Tenacibaculum mesophilum TaxID=104268 RepID=A0ABM7CII7_9FLAO|nr:hypothetical protein [Tenacibaculum mesophilum]AZJ33631.1 hypothetical protein D6200_14060 [Tenacibaculum mesophilum]QFS28873.1 hypothetical protein F9Y86_10870 [Tenacibaculum mesophilum]GFD80783.1 hypothetical protein KUL118_36450 [Tenacibaculum sp. KUL118]SHF56918.1 hypothetical protein SAMN05444344_0557 [Tenacibaculum mesophilum]